MSRETEPRAALRTWILEKNGELAESELADDTPLVERRILTSLDVMDLILFLERLRGRPVDVQSLGAGSFRDVDTIVSGFLESDA